MLSERVKDWTRQWREEGLEKGREEGREEGKEIARKTIARKLLAGGMTIEQVAELSELTITQAREILASLSEQEKQD